MRHLSSLIVAMLAGSVAGCSSAPGPAPALPPVPGPRPFGGVVYPPPDDQRLVHTATEILIRDCMRTKGQDYRPAPLADLTRASAANPYALLDPRHARIDGYGIVGEAISAASGPPADPNRAAVAALSDRDRQNWEAALVGTPSHQRTVELSTGATITVRTDGCTYAARRSLQGDDWDRLWAQAEADTNQVITRVTAAGPVTSAVTDWSACMTKAGYAYADLQGPRRDVTDRWQAATTPETRKSVAEYELRVAQEDSRCEESVTLPEIVGAAQDRAERELTTPALTAGHDALAKAWASAKAQASTIVGSASSAPA
ncbi:hypothetical protein [Actinoplanes awajinensis]|uniref:SCP domain-containing protein n=1 Tax=Actinoplanes awajinensis subsp. mycoplanecinus TaxID=135947 RepID=A0A101JRI9_9ACTN|nr:hypothetical protein [Actinoplanes awajinensis]KUL31695.1 hypothetical protein ADL15_21170 [Actinoplanes awajinensis subsp. mycoplanecinus]